MVYNFLYLCKFNSLLDEVYKTDKNVKNLLVLWMSIVLQIINLSFPIEIYIKLNET